MQSHLHRQLPGLLRQQFASLSGDLQRGDYRGALLSIRDCWEAFFKFSGIVLYCDALQSVSDIEHDDEIRECVLPLLRKPPTTGDWVAFYLNVAGYCQNSIKKRDLLFPELACTVVKSGVRSRLTSVGKLMWRVVQWRNDTIGHGSLSHDLTIVRREVEEQINLLCGFINNFTFLFEAKIASIGPNGDKVQFESDLYPEAKDRKHGGASHFPVWIHRNKSKFSLSPLLFMSIAEGRYSLLTYDKLKYGVFFLDYFLGTKVRFPCMPPELGIYSDALQGSKGRLVKTLQNSNVLSEKERSYTGAVSHALEQIEFGSDMACYFSQDYLLEALAGFISSREKLEEPGYFHLIGKAGTGKSWFAKSLTNAKHWHHAPKVIAYHIRVGMRQNPEVFMDALHDQVRNDSGHSVRGARIKLETHDDPASAFSTFLADVVLSSQQDGLILVVDGLDEILPVSNLEEPSIIDFLPLPNQLPDDVVVVLCSRPFEELRDHVRKKLEAIRTGLNYETLEISDHESQQKHLLESYLRIRKKIREEAFLQRILNAAGTSFLMANLLSQVYSLFPENTQTEINSGIAQAYEKLIHLMRTQIGGLLFDTLHLRLLCLLSVSPYPLSIWRISDLTGIQEEKLFFSLFDSAQFLAVSREANDNTYSILHYEIVEFFLSSYQPEIRLLLAQIVETFSQHGDTLDWLAGVDNLFVFSGATHLSLFLSDLLLNLETLPSAMRAKVRRNKCDMVHITGNYRDAASQLERLIDELQSENGLPTSDPKIVKAQLRRIHTLKFVSPLREIKSDLLRILDTITEEHIYWGEALFMWYGSLGCLDNPGFDDLQALISLTERCKREYDDYLMTRCLRRIADLQLAFGNADEARQVAANALTIAEAAGSRQAVYLYSTLGEICRKTGDYEKSLELFQTSLGRSRKNDLVGWIGHGELGLAETWRQLGNTEKAKVHCDRAWEAYQKANSQIWGQIHTGICSFFLTSDRKNLGQMGRIATSAGYIRDRIYINRLLNGFEWQSIGHNDHFLLFP